ncbi:MAG: hypothetical protein GC157_17410 [Frankiales bacterium]|nr:hypothetical protein [Frankiales bacterium]
MTTASIRFLPLGQIHIAFGDAYLTPGSGTHRLVFPVNMAGTWLEVATPMPSTAVLLVGTVWSSRPYFRWLGGLEPQVLTLHGSVVGEELVLTLSDDQLIALEAGRGEDDVALTLKLQATLLNPNPSVHPTNTEEVHYRITRTRWLELLDQVGAEVGILLRVPSPLTDASEQPPGAAAGDAASLAQATARLRQARAELRDHQWEHCVATCRRVLENLARLVELPSAADVFKVKAQDRTQDQRWAAIYYDVKGLASAAHHDDSTTDGFGWDAGDANAVLAATAGLLARYTAA